MSALKQIVFPLCCTAALLSACNKKDAAVSGSETTANKSELTLDQQIVIARAGFSPTYAAKVNGGYLVEGDILLSDAQLAGFTRELQAFRKAGPITEQYQSTYKVGSLPRIVRIAVDAGTSDPLFIAATDIAIARYNAQGLQLTFQRVDKAVAADIKILGEDLGTSGGSTILGVSAGFPDSAGNPATPIKLNNKYYSNTYKDTLTFATTIAHEIGHAIGFRHSDYMNRGYSCGYTPWNDFLKKLGIDNYNEGDGGVGAIHIPNTPVDPEARSWMLACSDGTDRPFTANDSIALRQLYH
ncbi:zinc-dependent metalloprotease [Chitinophaga nivalis]|uniref:Zinc-dependent metalloprotease n=1 Tax=Chitinophaga nivalis TaxID=2991709 RepID=A0ABT3IGX5_9BACT|nr:zinc-dependent metalloprotease [Chitinophaga nivalis]MCW3467095.1 zinc-dependent metalloprotease [Chitinophaga nivalis]MCW3483214.1 zinc-dependent metalloprotease [Chitinophaga nivalis]